MLTLDTPGMRLALAGGVLFLIAVISLLFLPQLIGVAGMVVGGTGVWCGFIVTIFSWYSHSGEPPAEGQ